MDRLEFDDPDPMRWWEYVVLALFLACAAPVLLLMALAGHLDTRRLK